jgi:Uma2 family endonuclease
MSTLPIPYRFTVEEYLTFERASDERHEYLDGVIYAMAGESEVHGTICTNLTGILFAQLRGTPCRIFSKDMKVRSGPDRAYTRKGLWSYPDLVVLCGEGRYHDTERDVLLNPRVLIEVLSPSTERYDRDTKWHRYQEWLPELQDYVLVEQAQPSVEHYGRRVLDDVWTYQRLAGLEAVLTFASIDCTVALRDIYERVTFVPGEHDDLPEP